MVSEKEEGNAEEGGREGRHRQPESRRRNGIARNAGEVD